MSLHRPADLTTPDFPVPCRPMAAFAAIEPLLKLCRTGRLYEVESWIAAGRPLQFPPSDDRKLKGRPTALQIAIDRGFHSLAALLLANGYDPNGDYYDCLTSAVRAKDHDLVDLLLQFGADPQSVDFCTVLETCERGLMDRFIAKGVDPCFNNAVARALDAKRRPILGFIKQYRDRFPALQRQIDIALRSAATEGSVRGVALTLWLGANPHAEVPSSAYEGDHHRGIGDTAFEDAVWSDKPELLTMMLKRPVPKTKADALLRLAAFRNRAGLVERLLKEGADPNSVDEEGMPLLYSFISGLMWRHTPRSVDEQERGLNALELVLKAGAKWEPDERHTRWLRRDLAGGESRLVIRLIDLLHEYGAISDARLRELTRTPAVRKVLNGYTRPRRNPFQEYYSAPVSPNPAPVAAPARGGYWKRHWSQR